jgi:hypothetical protein
MTRDALRFSLAYSAASLLVYLLLNIVDDHLPAQAGSLLNFLAALAACWFSASRFVRVRRRVATVVEAAAFAWRALLGVWLTILLLFVVMLAFFLTPEQAGALLLMFTVPRVLVATMIATSLFSAVYYLAIRWSFRWFTNRLAAR